MSYMPPMHTQLILVFAFSFWEIFVQTKSSDSKDSLQVHANIYLDSCSPIHTFKFHFQIPTVSKGFVCISVTSFFCPFNQLLELHLTFRKKMKMLNPIHQICFSSCVLSA